MRVHHARAALMLLPALVIASGSARPPSPQPSAPAHETFFYTHDGLQLEAYFYRPAGAGPFPLVVYNHGSALRSRERVERPFGFIGSLLPPAGYALLVPERRGYARSEGLTFSQEIGSDRGPRFVARLQAEAGDVLAAVEYVVRDPAFRIDGRRRAMVGWSFGGIVTTLAVSGRSDYQAAVVQAPGALTWDGSPALRDALLAAARKITIPMQCLVAENDATTKSTSEICGAVRNAPAELKVYPPFAPKGGPSSGHALFGPEGVPIWKADVLAFLDSRLHPARP